MIDLMKEEEIESNRFNGKFYYKYYKIKSNPHPKSGIILMVGPLFTDKIDQKNLEQIAKKNNVDLMQYDINMGKQDEPANYIFVFGKKLINKESLSEIGIQKSEVDIEKDNEEYIKQLKRAYNEYEKEINNQNS
ncbi:MAG: hypothetical protein ACTSRP_19200 [Candidatus Helarchaeota archaeon]